jgi:hypothetical protein
LSRPRIGLRPDGWRETVVGAGSRTVRAAPRAGAARTRRVVIVLPTTLPGLILHELAAAEDGRGRLVRAAGGTVVRASWLFATGGAGFVQAILARAADVYHLAGAGEELGGGPA